MKLGVILLSCNNWKLQNNVLNPVELSGLAHLFLY